MLKTVDAMLKTANAMLKPVGALLSVGFFFHLSHLGLRRGLRVLDRRRRRSSIAVSPSPCGKRARR
jgi:hypothetical protein